MTLPSTHEVFNQPPPLEDYDVFSADAALGEALEREGAGGPGPSWRPWAASAGSAASQELGRLANGIPPGSTPTTATGTASMSSSITPPTTS